LHKAIECGSDSGSPRRRGISTNSRRRRSSSMRDCDQMAADALVLNGILSENDACKYVDMLEDMNSKYLGCSAWPEDQSSSINAMRAASNCGSSGRCSGMFDDVKRVQEASSRTDTQAEMCEYLDLFLSMNSKYQGCDGWQDDIGSSIRDSKATMGCY